MSAGAKAFLFIVLAFMALSGVFTLVDAQEHGETLIWPLLVLALPLLSIGWLLTAIGSRVIDGWRYGGGRGQKLLVGLTTALVLGAGLVAWAGVTVESRRPSIELTAALGSACRGVAVTGAGAVDPTGERRNHLVVLAADGGEHGWTGYPPIEWRPPSLDDAELVACIAAEETRTRIEVCRYVNGSPITRYRVDRDVRVVEAATGNVVARFTVQGLPRECHQTERADLTELTGDVSWGMVEERIRGFVENGATGVTSPHPTGTVAPGSRTSPPSEPLPVRHVTLAAALDEGLVRVTLSGDGLQYVDLEMRSLSTDRLVIEVPAGTLFDPAVDATQSMVVILDNEIDLFPGEDDTWELPVACAEMRRDQPSESDEFTLRATAAEGDLARLLNADEFADHEFRVQQFAVWTITNNPPRRGYQGLGTAFSVFGTGPSAEELEAIGELFDDAGIDPRDYRALR